MSNNLFIINSKTMEKGILINYEVREDGRMYINLATKDGNPTPQHEYLSAITAALSLVIRMSGKDGDYKSEGETFKRVINYLESEFGNPDSYKDLMIHK